jgi:hypothetical protein
MSHPLFARARQHTITLRGYDNQGRLQYEKEDVPNRTATDETHWQTVMVPELQKKYARVMVLGQSGPEYKA